MRAWKIVVGICVIALISSGGHYVLQVLALPPVTMIGVGLVTAIAFVALIVRGISG